MAPALDRFADERLRDAARVDVGGVDEVDADVQRAVDDLGGLRLVGAVTERVATQPNGADLQAALTEVPVLHGLLLAFQYRRTIVLDGRAAVHPARRAGRDWAEHDGPRIWRGHRDRGRG